MKNNLYIGVFFVAMVAVVLVNVYQWCAPTYTYSVPVENVKIYTGLLRTKVVTDRGGFEATREAHAEFMGKALFLEMPIKSVTLREKGFDSEIVRFNFK